MYSPSENHTLFHTEGKTKSRHEMATRKKNWTVTLVITAICGVLASGHSFGYNLSVMQHFMNSSISSRYHVHIDDDQLRLIWSMFVSSFLLAGMIATLSGGVLCNRFGRKVAFCCDLILNIAGCFCFILCKSFNSVELMFLGRFLAGLGSGICSATCSIYLMELGPMKLRGLLGSCLALGISIGLLTGQILALDFILGNAACWNYLLGFYGLFPLLTLPYVIIVSPESPRFLSVVKNNPEKALSALKQVRNANQFELEDELKSMNLQTSRQEEKCTYSALFKNKTLFKFVLLLCTINMIQQLSGINAVFYYSRIIFEGAKFSATQTQYAILGTGLVSFLVTIVSVKANQKFGRRKLIMSSISGAMIFMLILTVCLNLKFPGTVYISTFSIYAYISSFAIGLGPIPNYIGSGQRSLAMSLGAFFQWLSNISVGLCFPFMQYFLREFSFLVFSGLCLAELIFIYFSLPETFNRDPADLVTSCDAEKQKQIENGLE